MAKLGIICIIRTCKFLKLTDTFYPHNIRKTIGIIRIHLYWSIWRNFLFILRISQYRQVPKHLRFKFIVFIFRLHISTIKLVILNRMNQFLFQIFFRYRSLILKIYSRIIPYKSRRSKLACGRIHLFNPKMYHLIIIPEILNDLSQIRRAIPKFHHRRI